MKPLTPIQIALLRKLADAGGSLFGRDFSRYERSALSRMQIHKGQTVSWDSNGAGGESNLDNWKVTITEAGRKALEEAS